MAEQKAMDGEGKPDYPFIDPRHQKQPFREKYSVSVPECAHDFVYFFRGFD
jgi:hypothetical protein